MSKYKRKLYDSTRINDFRELVNRYSNLYSEQIAFEFKKDPKSTEHIKITYSQFANDIKSLSTALLDLGLSKKRVALIAPNRYEWCVSYLAITTGNMIVVPLDKSLPDNEIKDLIIRSKAEAVIYDKKYESVFLEIFKENKSNLSFYIDMDTSTEFTGSNIYNYSELIKKGKK